MNLTFNYSQIYSIMNHIESEELICTIRALDTNQKPDAKDLCKLFDKFTEFYTMMKTRVIIANYLDFDFIGDIKVSYEDDDYALCFIMDGRTFYYYIFGKLLCVEDDMTNPNGKIDFLNLVPDHLHKHLNSLSII